MESVVYTIVAVAGGIFFGALAIWAAGFLITLVGAGLYNIGLGIVRVIARRPDNPPADIDRLDSQVMGAAAWPFIVGYWGASFFRWLVGLNRRTSRARTN